MTTATSLNEVKAQVIPILRRHGVVHAGIFGSFARGEADAESDVDILIEFDRTMVKSLFDLSALALDLEDCLGREVDVVTYQALNHRMRDNVLKEQVVLF